MLAESADANANLWYSWENNKKFDTQILAPTGSYNTVQVFGMGADGSVIISGRNKVTDFEKFQAQKPAEPDNPDNPGNPDNPDKPNNPDSPDKPGNPSSPSNPQRKKLNAPAKVKAAQLSTSHNVKITFSKVSGAKGYDIYRASKAKGSYKKIGNTKKQSYTDKTVKKAKTYYYKVVARADKTAYNSALSKKYAKVKVLARPSAKAKAAKAKKVTVSWQKVSLAQGYTVYTSTRKNKGYKAVKTAKKLYVKVRAYYKENGKKVYGPYSKTVSVRV